MVKSKNINLKLLIMSKEIYFKFIEKYAFIYIYTNT